MAGDLSRFRRQIEERRLKQSIRPVAYWISTLPGPFDAHCNFEARERAWRDCDPSLKDDDFIEGLAQLRYSMAGIKA